MPPFVSVLMPLKNGMPLLPEAVESILSQSHQHLELIVADDGSTDGGSAWLKARCRQDSRLHFLDSEGDRGIAHALNRAFDRARGEWIARMDHDDLSHPERLARQIDLALEKGWDLVSCRVKVPGCAGGMQAYIEWQNQLLEPESIANNRFVESPLVHPSVLFSRRLIDTHGGWRQGDFPEDYELWLRWLDGGAIMGKSPEELFIWREGSRRLTRVDERYRREAFDQVKAIWLKRWLDDHVVAGRPIWIWGAGRKSRDTLSALISQGCRQAAFVDIDPGKIGQHIQGRPVYAPDALLALDGQQKPFILAMVHSRGARELIAARLEEMQYQVGRDWLPAA